MTLFLWNMNIQDASEVCSIVKRLYVGAGLRSLLVLLKLSYKSETLIFKLQKSNIQELEEEIRLKHSTPTNTNSNLAEGGTIRHRKKSRPAPPPPPSMNVEHDLEIRNPSELLVGVPVTLKAQWRHKPGVLVIGTVDYTASVSIMFVF